MTRRIAVGSGRCVGRRRAVIGNRRCEAERGTATVFAVGVLPVLLSVCWIAMQLGGALITRHRVEGAADLAALAVAANAASGQRSACASAEWVARRMDATVRSCTLSGRHARIRLRAYQSPFVARFVAVNGRAHAGPVGG